MTDIKDISGETGRVGKPRRGVEKKKWEDMSMPEKIIGMVGVLAIIGVLVWGGYMIIAAANSASNQARQPASSHQDVSSKSEPLPQPTTVPLDKASQIAAWNIMYGSVFSTLSTDSGNIATDAGNGDLTAVSNDCTHLQADIKTAQSYPAIPDAQTAADYSSGLSYYADAAQDCIDGTANYDASLIAKSGQEITEGSSKIAAAISDIKALNSQQ